jgi:soluble lytic murein transglycosylase-like protein
MDDALRNADYTSKKFTQAASDTGKVASASTGPNKFADLEKQYNLPSGLLGSVEKQESGGNVNAKSAAGAEGAFQFMPSAWKQYGSGGNIHDEMDSAKAAAKYYHDLLDKYQGDLKKALAGYNWGAGNVDKRGLDNAPDETRKYIASIMSDMARKQSVAAGPVPGSTSASYANSNQSQQRQNAPAPIQVTISKSSGADVNVQVNALSMN